MSNPLTPAPELAKLGDRPTHTDLLVVGSDPAGSVLAALMAGAGYKVMQIDTRGGQSSLCSERVAGAAAALLRALGLEQKITSQHFPLCTGFELLGPSPSEGLRVPLVPVGWHARDADLRQLLLEHAASRGVQVVRGRPASVLTEGERVTGLCWDAPGDPPHPQRTLSRVLVDAGGADAFLSAQAIAGARQLQDGADQVEVRAVYRGLEPFKMTQNAAGSQRSLTPIAGQDPLWRTRSRLFYTPSGQTATLLPSASALQTLIVRVSREHYERHAHTPRALLRWGLASIHPKLWSRQEEAVQVGPIEHDLRSSFRIEPFVGDGWLCLGSAHRRGDRCFSPELALSLREALDASALLRAHDLGRCSAAGLSGFVERSDRAHQVAEDLARYFWRSPSFFLQLIQGRLGEAFLSLLRNESLEGRDPAQQEARELIRGGLTLQPLQAAGSLPANKLADRVRERCAAQAEIQAAFLELGEHGACLSLVLSSQSSESGGLHDFERALYEEFGHDRLVVMRWSETPADLLTPPSFDPSTRVFDRRAS